MTNTATNTRKSYTYADPNASTYRTALKQKDGSFKAMRGRPARSLETAMAALNAKQVDRLGRRNPAVLKDAIIVMVESDGSFTPAANLNRDGSFNRI